MCEMSPRTQKTQKVAKHERSESSIKNSSSYSRRSSKQSSDQPSGSELKTGQDAERAFAKIGVRELLEFDPRPTFVLDLIAYGEIDEEEEVDFEPLYCNSAFLSNDNLTAELLSKRKSELPPDGSQLEFKRWTNVRASGISRPRAFQYRDILWTGFIVGGRWRVISGTPVSHIDEALIESPTILTGAGKDLKKTYDGSAKPFASPTKSETSSPSPPASIHDEAPETTGEYHNLGTPDWTVPHPKGYLTPHMHFARNVDWASTALGDMSTWSPELRQLVNLLMVNPHPAAIYWGEEYTMIYNEQYAINVAGRKHPTLMGTGFRKAFVEIKTLVGSLFTHAMRTGQAVAQVEQMLPIERFGFLEETYYSWSLIPIYGGTGSIQGLWNTPIETTRQTIADRRTRTLLQLGEEVSLATSVPSFWSRILKPLEANEFDFPFALLYSVLDDVEGDEVSSISSESSHTMKSCVLEGMLGVPVDSEAAPAKLDLKRARGGFIPAFRDAMRTREPTILDILDGTLPESLIKGFEWRGFGEPCKQAVVCPIRPTTSETVLGFLVVGINPRRAWDADYQTFIRLLNRQLATSLASVTLFEAEIKRGSTAAEAAALERMKLSEELAVQRSRMQRMAEVSPVGMFSIDPQGLLLEANDRWFEQTGHPRDTLYEMSWMEVIDPSSVPIVEDGWKRLTVDGLPWSAELKLKKRWHDPNLENHELIDHWILAASQPEFAPDGTLKSIMGCITDITLQKRSAQDAMTRAKLSEELLLRTQEAKENEKNFKRFTDIVPGGLFIMDAEQRITYANSQWFSISGYPEIDVSDAPLSWSLAILEDDLPEYNSKWEQMITEYSTITTEVRMRAPAKIEFGGRFLDVQRWILASAIPEVSEDGSLRSVMGCITDITRIKWAEGLQNRRLLEAEENRRQQNNFIDITSHEMRNPLSAILQCADGISSSLTEYKASQPVLDGLLLEAIDSSIEAAETVQLCAQHQKSIVDDILTISKLDSDLLLITPVPIRPIEVVRQSLKMFVAECQMNKIDMKFHIDGSFEALRLSNVMLDSSRLLQVLINLLTNAIKFTKSEAIRSIDVGISAHLGPPHEQNPKFDYFPTNKAKADVTAGSEWGTGEIIYLRFEVKDTGCGLTNEEKNKLFTRFSQASPRTHIQYGGSGLGLFISRQLTELQGGEIGVASESGVGSTFAFYLKSRRVEQEVSTESMNSRLQLDLQSQSRLVTNVPMNVAQGETTTSVSKLLQAVDLTRSPSTTPPAPVSPGDLYVLIVEDNLVNQRILAAQIKKLGCVVYVANHGGEALEILKETKYFKGRELDGKDLSVILMDLEMPVMDGLTCVRAIREMQTQGLILGHVPIIAVTANARGEQIATAKDSGMDDVMPKPFRIRQLIPKIEALLQKTAAMNAS